MTIDHDSLPLGRHMDVDPVDPVGARTVDRYDAAVLHAFAYHVNAWNLGDYTVALEVGGILLQPQRAFAQLIRVFNQNQFIDH